MISADYVNLKSRIQKQQKKKNRKIRIYHSFFSIVVLLCIVHIAYSALLNLAKIVTYQTKIGQAQELKSKAELRNKQLKNEIQNFSSMYKVESIARNNLKMAAKDEVLIIINQPEVEEKKSDRIPNNKFTNFLMSLSNNFNKDISSDKILD